MDKYEHAEAFCLMRYQCEKCGTLEVLWNSRDGVTPFCIECIQQECGGTMRHVSWDQDECDPEYCPFVGQRVFIDLTPEIQEIYKRAFVRKHWIHGDYPMKERWPNPMAAVKDLLKDSPLHGDPFVLIV